ncbi:hypothetical protein VitviT2T_024621 [Vitis vinifera]|uniref:Retrovirus-related Pol polyprotein from transposon TNT 1-94 n=1 Tax=Vitis vinifera TaxID=29760 RepID=A0ABY9DJF1_VITVI|nr:hypothetical protein VitviT2T_024621 [Vitis vinifera]
MFSRFLVIVNELEALGKTYTEVEKVMKILRSLPKKWETKVTAIQEAKDLTKLSLEELIGSLMTYEIELYNHQRVEENEKSIAFMAITNDDEEEESESESESDESAKEIWKLLEVTYEGNDEVKESKINVLMHDYKLFSIKEFESIVEMFSRFLVIVNELETLEKTYTEVQELYDVYMGQPTELHLQTAKRVLRYLRGTTNLGIFYKKGGNDKLVAFTDSDYADDLEDRKSTSGYVFMLSSGAVSWSSRKQPVVSLSTTEVEFIAATSCACQAIWMRRILEKLSHTQGNCTTMFCDNSSTIKLSKNPMMHGRSKHIDVHFHFLRDLTKEGVVELVHCGTQDQIADVMTKPLKLDMFLKLRELMGVREVPDNFSPSGRPVGIRFGRFSRFIESAEPTTNPYGFLVVKQAEKTEGSELALGRNPRGSNAKRGMSIKGERIGEQRTLDILERGNSAGEKNKRSVASSELRVWGKLQHCGFFEEESDSLSVLEVIIGMHGSYLVEILRSTFKSAICIVVLLDIKVTFLPAIDKSNHKLVAKAMYEVRYIDLDDH